MAKAFDLRPFATGLALVFTQAFASIGCGPTEGPKPITPTKAVATTAPVASRVVEDRTPAEKPAGIVLEMHTIGLRPMLRAIKGFLPQGVDATKIDPRKVLKDLPDGGTLARIVDIDKPIDFIVAVPETRETKKSTSNPRPVYAVAVAIEDDLDVKSALKGVATIDPQPGGILRLVPTGGGEDHCVIAPALGPAKHRLVCVFDRRSADVSGLHAWLARGVTQKPEGGPAFRMDIDLAALKTRFAQELDKVRNEARAVVGPEVKVGHPEMDRVLKQLAKNVVDEVFDFVDDLDTVHLEGDITSDALVGGATIGLRDAKSWTARALLSGGDTAPAAGTGAALLAKLPADGALLGTFVRATTQTDALLTPFETAFRDLADATATDFKWPKKDRDLALDLVKNGFAAARGGLAATSGGDGRLDRKDGPRPRRGLARDLVDAFSAKAWSVLATDKDPKPWVALLDGFSQLVTRPAFASTLRELGKDALTVKITAKPTLAKELPKGSLARRFEMEVLGLEQLKEYDFDPDPPPVKNAPKPKQVSFGKFTGEWVITSDGGRTLSAWGENLAEGEVWKRVQSAITDPNGIGVSPGFEFVAGPPATTGGVFFLDGAVHAVGGGKKAQEFLGRLPDGGRTPIAWRLVPSKPPKSATEIGVRLPRDVVAGIFYAFLR